MADNVATALKNLNKELNEADVKIRAAQGDSQALFDAIVQGVGKSKDAFRSLVSELSGTDIKGARTIDIVTRLVDEHGKKLTPASIKSTIENITDDNKPQTLGLFQYKTSDLNTLQQMLAMSKKDSADLLSTVLKISNASVGLNKVQGTAYSNALANRIKEEARARNKIIKLQERQLQLEQAIDRASSNQSGKTKFEGKMRSVADLNKELADTARLISQQNAILQGSGRGQNVAKALGIGTAKKEADMLNNSLSKTIGLAQRLGYAFGIAFSAQGLVQFGKKLVETRGEFELQQVALRSIVNDKMAADTIWAQTLQQSLQSPFKAMDLVKYTKQLAAYRIETYKLFDTTKRLADVAAGLGVDMQRLILAYGQVKAANYLRASEIRQFTEAGVNILGELSTHLSKVKGHFVSTAEVMDMVQKRMVKFEAVEEVFKNLTKEGGIFYNMQYIQSQTVSGQVQKLHDAYDQMLNSIGKSNQGAIKNIISVLNGLVQNWQSVATTIKSIGWGVAIGWLLKYATAMLGVGTASMSTKKALVSLKLSIDGIGKALKANLPMLAIGAITALITSIVESVREVKQINNEIDEQITTLYGSSEKMKNYQETIEKNNELIKTHGKEISDNKKRQEALNKALSENNSIFAELKNNYPQIVENLRQNENGTIDNTTALKKYNDQLEREMTLLAMKERGYIPFDATPTEDMQNAQKEIAKVQTTIRNTQLKLKADLAKMKASGKEDKDQIKLAEEYLAIPTEGDMIIAAEKARKVYEKAKHQLILNEVEERGRKLSAKKKDNTILKELTGLDNRDISSNIKSQYAELEKETTRIDWIKKLKTDFAKEIKGFSDFSEKINKEYSGDILAFIANNGELINTAVAGVEDADGKIKNAAPQLVQGIGDALMATGNATTKGMQEFWNTLLNQVVVFTAANKEYTRLNLLIADEYAKKESERNQKYLDSLLKQKEEFMKKNRIDFFAASNKSYDDGKKNGLEDDEGPKNYKSINSLISLLEEMNRSYEKLSKSAYGFAKSQDMVVDSFSPAFKEIFGFLGIDIKQADTWSKRALANTMKTVIDKMDAEKLWGKFGSDGGKEARNAFIKKWNSVLTEVDVAVSVEMRDDFAREMEKAFNDYDLTHELQGLNLREDMAKDIFPDLEYTTIGKLQAIMDNFAAERGKKDEKGNTFFSKDDLEVYRKWSDKIDAEILKSRKEKVKQYGKFLEQEYSERAKLEMQHAKDVAFVTANVSDEGKRDNIIKNINEKFEKDLNELNWKSFKESAFYVEMMDDLSSIPMEYMRLMLGKIEEILQHPETLSPRALKEAINARQKIIEAQMDFDQIAVMRDSMKEIREAAKSPENGGVGGANWRQTKKNLDEEQKAQAEKLANIEEQIEKDKELQGQVKALEDAQLAVANANRALGKSVEADIERNYGNAESVLAGYKDELEGLQKDVSKFTTRQQNIGKQDEEGNLIEITQAEKDINAANEKRIADLQRIIPLLDAYIKAIEQQADVEGRLGGAVKAQAEGKTSTSIGQDIQGKQNKADEITERLTVIKRWQKAFVNFNNAFAKFNQNAVNMVNRIGALGSAASDTFEALGSETNALTEGWKEFGNTVVSVITEALTMIPSLVTGFVTAGTSINAAMGIIGLIAEAIQLVITLIGALAKLHDAGYEKEIENQQKKIDELKSAYERLEKAIEKTWTTMTYIDTYNQQVENIKQQIEALEAQRNAENSKKNTDENKIREYGDSIQEAYDELEELEQKRIEVFGGIGEEGYRSAAEGFVEAWKSAFLETGDGLQGLQDHFDEFLQDWFVKQATMRIAGGMLEPVFRQIDAAVDQYGEGGTSAMLSEIERARDMVAAIFPDLSLALEDLSGMFGVGGEGSLSGLAAGIQGMTEEQANILEAYWNSVRMYTANLDGNVERIANILGAGGSATNPQLQQLQIIAQHTQAIHTLLDKVTRSGHPQGGLGIKVFNN